MKPLNVRCHNLEFLNKKFENSKGVFIGTTGNTAREMFTYMPSTNQSLGL